MGVGSVVLYFYITDCEAAGSALLSRKFARLYDLAGKWGIVGFPAFIALAKLFTGIKKLAGSKQAD